jgi:hypothetical protein
MYMKGYIPPAQPGLTEKVGSTGGRRVSFVRHRLPQKAGTQQLFSGRKEKQHWDIQLGEKESRRTRMLDSFSSLLGREGMQQFRVRWVLSALPGHAF